MKIKISNVLIGAQERLFGYIGQMSYEYSQLSIKADPSSLLGFEEVVNDKPMRMEDLARVVIHDEEDDDDKIDIYPNEPSFLPTIISGMTSIHPEMKITVEKYEEAEEDDDNPELKFIRLTMPKMNDCLLYTSPSPRDFASSRMPSSA